MKLWDKGTNTRQNVHDFTVGHDRDFDYALAEHDIRASIAHAMMLAEVNIISESDAVSLVHELREIYSSLTRNEFIISDEAEDVHSQLEFILTHKLGDIGKKIHTGRSRNDQVLVDIKLYLRAQLTSIQQQVQTLFDCLLSLAEQHKEHLLPGYTHFQIAMPSSFGLWFSAYAESLVDDMESVVAAFHVVNKNPLGSAAGFGSSFGLNRQRTTDLLGFETMNVSSVYAQMTRGKSERVCAIALASIGATISRMCYDLCLYCSQNFAFVQLPTEYSTGSSIMPHKSNPDVFELMRARCNRLQSLPIDISLIINNLPSGYHRDFQILKDLIFPAFSELQSCLQLCTEILPTLRINSQILEDTKYSYLFSVDAVHALVQQGMSFRDAYKHIAEQIQKGDFQTPAVAAHSHEGSIGNLQLQLISQQMLKVCAAMDIESYQASEAALING